MQEYRSGEWGYVGGRRFASKAGFGLLSASSLNILGTDQDMLFQTQHPGLDIELIGVVGETILNAVRIVRVD